MHILLYFSRDIIITIITCDNDNINCVNQNNKVCLITHIGCLLLITFIRNLPSFHTNVHVLHIQNQWFHHTFTSVHNTSQPYLLLLIIIEMLSYTSNRVRQKSLITQGNNIYMKMSIQSVEQINV